MNRIRKEVSGKTASALEIRFEPQSLTSHAGLVVFQRLFSRLQLKERLRGCFRHESGRRAYAPHVVTLLLVVHLLLGCRELRDMARYRNDEAVLGKVNVSYGDAGFGSMGSPRQGHITKTLGASVSITMDFEDIRRNTLFTPRNYWQQFARVLLHEYHHAYDILSYKCANPHVGKKLTRQQYEDETWRKTNDDFDLLFGRANAACLAD